MVEFPGELLGIVVIIKIKSCGMVISHLQESATERTLLSNKLLGDFCCHMVDQQARQPFMELGARNGRVKCELGNFTQRCDGVIANVSICR